ncbi:MAG: hypothetical protein WD757_03295 [Actinomycetota bacterium]
MSDPIESRVDGWEKHRLDQLRRESEATPLQRLRWLEEAIAFAFRAGALPRRSSPAAARPGFH